MYWATFPLLSESTTKVPGIFVALELPDFLRNVRFYHFGHLDVLQMELITIQTCVDVLSPCPPRRPPDGTDHDTNMC